MTAIIIGILCILLVCQILKTILKTSIINKNKIDYVLEYIVSIIIFVTMFMQEYILRNKLLVIVVLGIIYEIISLIYMYFRYYKKETITDFSIKKVTDECEVGILVLKGKKVKLINNKMYEILNKLNIKKDYVTNIIKQSIDQLDKNYCVKVEDKYYVFVVNDNEIITFDITEEYELHQKLNDQNRKIKENNKQILLSIDNIEELEREKNLLKLKNKYHDILGQNLSILQQYLNRENISQENFEEIKFMIQKMFIDIEDTEDTNTNLENLIKIHKKNGTDIVINGKLPQNKEVAKVFFEIIREATTNAIRHAGSSKVFVNIKETLEETYMIITNNGKKSNEFITENQGIKDMRRKIEKLGGMFYISTLPEFSVNISIKNNC
jgi:histidine kinase